MTIVALSPAIKPRLPLLTTSAQRAFNTCRRLYRHRYVDGIRTVGDDAEELRFGSAAHGALDPWWRHVGADRLTAAEEALAAMELEAFDRVRLEELIRGYHFRWVDETDAEYEVLAVEEPYCVPLRNPETGAPSRTFEAAGAKDAVARKRADGGEWVVEHKTSSSDIGAGSTYWQQLRLDVQVSNYFNAAKEAGKDVRGCLYDVIKKPGIRPLKATPVESRKYTKQGQLYANQRDTDETPEEFRARLREDIASDPDRYFQRGEVVRLERESEEAAADLWLTATAIKDAQRLGQWPRNTARCFDWGRPCAYWAACSGEASINDPLRFKRVEQVHSELRIEPSITNNTGDNSNGNTDEQSTLFPSHDAGVSAAG